MKILKKHDKVTGRPLKDTILRRVSQQPFWSTDMLERLVKEAQDLFDQLQTCTAETDKDTELENRQEKQESLIDVPKLVAGPDSEEVDNTLLQRFDSALQAWQRQGFKTGRYANNVSVPLSRVPNLLVWGWVPFGSNSCSSIL